MTYIALALALACLVLAALAGRYRYLQRGATASATYHRTRYQTEVATVRRIQFGPEYRSDGASGCPVCGERVDIGRVVFLLVEPPSSSVRAPSKQVAIEWFSTPYVTAHVVRFDPCGCVWDSTAGADTVQGGFDLVCAVNSETGLARFGLTTREVDPDGCPPQIITEVRGGECAL